MAEAAQPALILLPSIILGAIIGFYEIIIIHRDVTVKLHRFSHGIHALVLSILFVFASMNVDFVFGLIPALKSIPIIGMPLVFRLIIGLLAAIKIHGVSRAIKSSGGGGGGPGLGETWIHSILIGGLMIAAPYVYPFIAPILPKWMK